MHPGACGARPPYRGRQRAWQSYCSLGVQAWREKEGARAIVVVAQLRVCSPLLQEERDHVEGIDGARLVRAKRARREDQDVEARCENLRDKRRVYPRLRRRGMSHKGISVPAKGHERVGTRLDPLRQRKHDTPVVGGSDANTGIDFLRGANAGPQQ